MLIIFLSQRNFGRPGAVGGPESFRKALSNLAFHHQQVHLFDAGDVACEDGQLERSQEILGEKTATLIEKKYFPILIGGGHEMAWGHFRAIEKILRKEPQKKLGIINLDAHFDLRPYSEGSNSGSPFLQMADYLKLNNTNFSYLALGIQEASNTQALFESAKSLNVQYLLTEDCQAWNTQPLLSKVSRFIENLDMIYLSVDMDVFAAHLSPGVSAPALHGIDPQCALELFSILVKSKKLVSIDFAELNPTFDLDNRTAKLMAYLVHKFLQNWNN